MDDSIPELQQIADELAIRRVLYRYARGVDRRDMALVRSCYHPDAHDNHGLFKGGIDDLIRWMETHPDRPEFTIHFLGNMLIDVRGDIALCETYCMATHRYVAKDGSASDFILDVRFLDRFERREGQWKIADRVCVFDNPGRTYAADATATMPKAWAAGSYGEMDPSYRLFKA